jgi:hypothetical protein
MKCQYLRSFRALTPALCLASALVSLNVRATPYASSLTNNAGIVSFRLNEAADSVRVVGNANTLTNVLGARALGLTVTNLTSFGLTGGVFSVIVQNVRSNVVAQIGASISNYNSGRGIAVNANPASAAFGRIYAGNSLGGTLGDGVYVYNADFSNPFGASTNLRTAGYDFVGAGSASPFHLTVAPNDQVYICDWGDSAGNLIVSDPDLTSFEYILQPLTGTAAIPVGSNNIHGSVQAVAITGSTNTGDLKVYSIDEDYAQDPAAPAGMNQWNSLWEYDIGSGPLPWTNPPNKLLLVPGINFLSQNDDVTIGPNGYLYFNQRRANSSLTTWSPSLYVVDPAVYIDPTNYSDFYNPALTNWTGYQSNVYSHASTAAGGWIWESQTATHTVTAGTGIDRFQDINGVSISPDGKYIAGITFAQNPAANTIIICPVTNGIPDVARTFTIAVGGSGSGRSLAWDRANNLYMLSSGATTPLNQVRAYSLAFNSVATSTSDGTFSLVTPVNEVWVGAGDALATEGSPATDTASFTFYRNGDLTAPLTVTYAITGTASNGTDYTNEFGVALPTTITFAAGASSTNITIVPIDDALTEPLETVVLTIQGRSTYTSLYNKAATVAIGDNELPEITILPVGANTNMYERVPNDFARYQLVRRGSTNDAVSVNIGYAGGVNGTDFTGQGSISLGAGLGSVNFDINPLDNSVVDGTRTLTITVAPAGAGEYLVGTTNTAFAKIIDDDLPSEVGNTLWSEDFEAANPGHNVVPANWKFAFIATNGVADYSFDFGFDYAIHGIPAAPGAITTLGLKATVNKDDTSPFAAALNFYPVGAPTFTNDYAFRFNMLLMVNTASNNTEHAIFGINHSGDKTNWLNSSGTALNGNNQDGLWFTVNVSGGNLNDNTLFTKGTTAAGPLSISNRASTTLTHVFKNPPYISAGAPGIAQTATPTWTWLDVEVAQTTNMIAMRLNNTLIIATTNITTFKQGNVMLGYNDAFNSIGGLGGAVVYDNARVVRITPPVITTQPTGRAVVAGNGTTLTVAATTSTGVTNYQWFRNGVAIAGATSATLVLSNFQSANAGTYTVVVDDGRYPVSSTDTVVSLATAPVLSVSLAGTTVTLKFNTLVGPTYYTEFKNALPDASWLPLSTNIGNGSQVTLTDDSSGSATRFYRVRAQ